MIEQDDTQPVWERLENQGESARWYSRFLLYRNMKPARRSLLGAYNIYQSQAVNSPKKAYNTVPGAWKDAADKYDWKFRADLWDSKLQAEQEERERILREAESAEIEKIMTTGYAAIHRRVEALSDMATLIKLSFLENPNDSLDKIKFEWVTPDKIREFRGCLDDIAKELGHRVKKQEITGKDGMPLQTERNADLTTLTDDELDQLHTMLVKASERRENGTSTV